MKIKAALLVLVIGYILDFIGAWMKITHQAFADLTLGLAAFLKIIGLLSFIILLLAHPKVRQFLNYKEFDDSFK